MEKEALFAKHPAARGYLRDANGMRLMDRRDELCDKLLEELRQRSHDLGGESRYPLASLDPSTDPAGELAIDEP